MVKGIQDAPRRARRDDTVTQGFVWRMLRFFAQDVWTPDRVKRGGPFYRVCRILYLAAKGFVEDSCLFRASALTYITVLSLVPLLAFAFSVAKGFGFYEGLLNDTINPFLNRTFGSLDSAAQSPLVHEPGAYEMRGAIDQVLRFVERTEVSTLGFFGLVILLYTVIKLLGTIERSFNDIWGVQRSRSVIRKISDYLAMVVVTPIFLFVATGMTTAAQNSSVVEYLRVHLGLGAAIEVLLRLMPLFALWIGFTFIYLAMPNTKTRWSSAIVGAIIAGTLWQITLVLHVKFQIGIARYNAIYSSFAALPIFLMWVNISWTIVLLGAEICFAHQSEPSYVHVAQSRPSDQAFKELLGVRAMTRIGQGFLEGARPRTVSALSVELSVPQRTLEEVMYLLVDGGLLVETVEDHEHGFLPARHLESITVKSIQDVLKHTAGLVEVPPTSAVDEQIDRLLAGLEDERAKSTFNRTLQSLAESAVRESAARERAAASSVAAQSPARA